MLEGNNTMLCSYGCSKEGIYTFKNGKVCCSSHFRKCDNQKNKLIKYHINSKRSDNTKLKIKEVNLKKRIIRLNIQSNNKMEVKKNIETEKIFM